MERLSEWMGEPTTLSIVERLGEWMGEPYAARTLERFNVQMQFQGKKKYELHRSLIAIFETIRLLKQTMTVDNDNESMTIDDSSRLTERLRQNQACCLKPLKMVSTIVILLI